LLYQLTIDFKLGDHVDQVARYALLLGSWLISVIPPSGSRLCRVSSSASVAGLKLRVIFWLLSCGQGIQ
jgi:hypothetical protein